MLDSMCCRPIWTAEVDPYVLRVRCEPCDPRAPFAFIWRARHGRIATAPNRQHVRIDDGGGGIRLDVVAGSILDDAVQLEPVISFRRDVDRQIQAVKRLRALLAGEPIIAEPDARLPRLILALRALDAVWEGASLREIGTVLLGNAAWPGDGEWMKSWARRIVALGHRLTASGPRGVLGQNI